VSINAWATKGPNRPLEPFSYDPGPLAADYVEIAVETALDLPLDVRGTPFQHRVWQALREIPVRPTATYSEIAERIGMPKASQGRGGSACCEQDRHCYSVSPGRAQRWFAVKLPLGRGK
jgi:hypothetical protein